MINKKQKLLQLIILETTFKICIPGMMIIKALMLKIFDANKSVLLCVHSIFLCFALLPSFSFIPK